MLLLLEKGSQSYPKRWNTVFIATNATGTFQKEISAAATQGFRFAPGTLLNKKSGIGGDEVVAVMEKPGRVSKRYEYKIIATNQTSTLESEWVVAMSQGYKAVGIVTRSEVMLLMEREAQ